MGNMNEVQSSPIGQSLRRREDRRFLTGDGQYTDDVTMHGQTYGVFLRSPHRMLASARSSSTRRRRRPASCASSPVPISPRPRSAACLAAG